MPLFLLGLEVLRGWGAEFVRIDFTMDGESNSKGLSLRDVRLGYNSNVV